MHLYESTLPVHPHKSLTFADFDNMEDMYHIHFEDDLICKDWLEMYTTEILMFGINGLMFKMSLISNSISSP